MNSKIRTDNPSENPDPITHTPGAHPLGTGVGAAVGGAAGIGAAVAAGAATGSVGGPIGTAVGAAIGAVAGGLIGKGVGEGVNPTAEHQYWREHYLDRPYARNGVAYEQYAPAYQAGWEARQAYGGDSFDDVQGQLGQDWSTRRGSSELDWNDARHAARDAWNRASTRPPQHH